MPSPTPVRHTVRSTLLRIHRAADVIAALDNVCAAGAQSTDVQNAPAAKLALTNLTVAVSAAAVAQAGRLGFLSILAAATKGLRIDLSGCETALRTYESAVDRIAAGDAEIINQAGLPSRDMKTPPAALGTLAAKDVRQKPGKVQATGIVSWPPVARATGYAIQVNPTPQNPGGPYTALNPGSARRRVVTGPAPGAQVLVQIAALAGDGTQSPWCEPVLVTTR